MFFIAPDSYSRSFCAVCAVVFIVGVIFTLKPIEKKQQFSFFNIIFLFSYFWTSFAYPLIVYGTFRDRENIINKYIDWENMSHTSALALVFICAYFLGYAKKWNACVYTSTSKFGTKSLRVPNGLFIFFSIAYIINACYSYFLTGNINLSTGKFLTDIYFSFLVFVMYANTNNHQNYKHDLKNFVAINMFPILFICIVFFVSMIIGDRGPAIKATLVFFATYHFFWNKVNITKVVLFGGIFLCLLFFVRQTRLSNEGLVSGNVSMSQIEKTFNLENGNLYVFADLFLINRELNLEYDYAKKRGMFHPEKVLFLPLYPIPIVPSVFSQLFFEKTVADMDTGSELNKYLRHVETHFGNHPAGDLFMSFGLIGVIVFSYFFGLVVSYYEKRMYSNVYTACAFIVLMSWSLYLSRASVLSIIRPLGYVYIFGYFIFSVSTKIRKKI